MTDTALPPCLHDLTTGTPGAGLVLAHCGYRPEAFDEGAFAGADIEPPAALAGAIAKRRTEYLAGRVCARAGLRHALGLEAVPGIGADRAPRWPVGAVGAITHSRGRAAALVGDGANWQGLGLDVEHWLAPARAARLCGELLTPVEREALAGLSEDALARHVTLTFSVKESLFKALYPLTGRRFYFQDAALEDGRIRLLTDLSEDWSAGTCLSFRAEEESAGVLSWITIPR
ncbi:4'-phosphopantetheinyl transferase superfamily protein [Alcanivorax sp. ST75FaO-1]|nr:4'-phosphopantetheinyl transferase superfamily protein [Alloalcanivorax profundimaris]